MLQGLFFDDGLVCKICKTAERLEVMDTYYAHEAFKVFPLGKYQNQAKIGSWFKGINEEDTDGDADKDFSA